MKLNRFFVGFVVLVIVLLALSQLLQPKMFVWSPTFLPSDQQPLGCYVFDSVMRKVCPNGYSVTGKSLYQLNHDGSKEPRSILIVTDNFRYTESDLKQMDALLHRGNRIMIAAYNDDVVQESESGDTVYVNQDEDEFSEKYGFSPNLPFYKRYGCEWERPYYMSSDFKSSLLSDKAHNVVDILWVGRLNQFPQRSFRNIEKIWTQAYISIPDASQGAGWEPVAVRHNENFEDKDSTENYSEPLSTGIYTHAYNNGPYYAAQAVSRRVGKGELILVSMPLVFTNYGILNDNIGLYTMRLMSLLADRPIVRTTGYMETEDSFEAKSSPMREFLKREPLRHALWIAMLGVLLFFLFTARRRQRVIPVITKPQNSNLEFIQMIGSLFYQKHKNRDLALRRWTCFVDDVNRLAGIDLSIPGSFGDASASIARKTGLKEDALKRDFGILNQVIEKEDEIKDSELQYVIDFMNEVTKKLK